MALDNRPNREPRVLPTIRVVHVRRALLLFAIVIGLAALAASLSRSGGRRGEPPAGSGADDGDHEPEPAPEASPREDTTAVAEDGDTIELNAAEDDTRRLEAGRSVSIEVAVVEPGQVTIPLLGLTGAADPLTPARFDVLVNSEGRYPIEFIPSGSGEPRCRGDDRRDLAERLRRVAAGLVALVLIAGCSSDDPRSFGHADGGLRATRRGPELAAAAAASLRRGLRQLLRRRRPDRLRRARGSRR